MTTSHFTNPPKQGDGKNRLQNSVGMRERLAFERGVRVTLSRFDRAVRANACEVCDAELRTGLAGTLGDWGDGTADYISTPEPVELDKSRIEFMPVKGGAVCGNFPNVARHQPLNAARQTRRDSRK